MRFDVEVTGVQNVTDWMRQLPDQIRAEGLTSMENLVSEMVSYVINDKLAGQVLTKRSGRLANSIFGSAVIAGEQVVGTVGSRGVPYAGIQEYGGTTPAHDIYPNAAKALSFMWGGERAIFAHVHHPGSKIPENSYLRSTALDMHGQILDELRTGVLRAIQR
jgi:phage gpG-like protein